MQNLTYIRLYGWPQKFDDHDSHIKPISDKAKQGPLTAIKAYIIKGSKITGVYF